jgi:signal transduction histidine kinase
VVCASQIEISEQSVPIKSLLVLLSESRRRVYTLPMFQVFVNALASLMMEIQSLETEIRTQWFPLPLLPVSSPPVSEEQRQQKVADILIRAESYSRALSLVSSGRQLARMRTGFSKGGRITHNDLTAMLVELRVRIGEDLQDRVFFSITDPVRIQKFSKRAPKKRLRTVWFSRTWRRYLTRKS